MNNLFKNPFINNTNNTKIVSNYNKNNNFGRVSTDEIRSNMNSLNTNFDSKMSVNNSDTDISSREDVNFNNQINKNVNYTNFYKNMRNKNGN